MHVEIASVLGPALAVEALIADNMWGSETKNKAVIIRKEHF